MRDEWPKGTEFSFEGMRLRAMDDKICGILEETTMFERKGSNDVRIAIQVAIKCGRLERLDGK